MRYINPVAQGLKRVEVNSNREYDIEASQSEWAANKRKYFADVLFKKPVILEESEVDY